MNETFKSVVFLCMLLATSMVSAQNAAIYFLQEELEELSTNDEEYDWEEELEELTIRLSEPLDLNTATRKELQQFPFLTDLQIENIQAYIYLHGAMNTIYELQAIEEMDKRTIELLLPFVCVKPVEEKRRYPTLQNILKYGHHQLLTRIDLPFYTRKGYDKEYLGPSIYHSARYEFRYADYLKVGFTAEKDAGEPFFALHAAKGYDYYSPYLFIQNMGKIKALALGNYRLSFGQGLVLNTDFGLGKSFALSSSNYRSRGIRKHSSTDEYNYFSGAALTFEPITRLRLSAFYSHRNMDGVVSEGNITSIYKTGLHRSQKEADKEHAFAMQLAGGNIAYQKGTLALGLTGIYYFFDRPYEPKLNKYARYNLRGNYFYNLGFDYSYRLGRFLLMGEAATGKQGYALLNRLTYELTSGYRLMLLHRYYTHNYWAMFARSFGEGSAPQNENGWYLAGEAAPWAHWRFFASIDLFSFPWWKYRISKPSQGVDVMARATYSPVPPLSMYASYRYKRKERDVTGTSGAVIRHTHQHRWRYRLTYERNAMRLQTTVDYNRFQSQDTEPANGWQCTQSFAYSFDRLPFSVALQGSYFTTFDYDSRVYIYEKGLLNTFYTPSFYGKGFRCSAHLRCDFNKHIMLIAKLGQTIYQDRDEIGSGNDLIASNCKADLQFQLRIKL